MNFERKITILSVGVAIVATLAASVQSYVSWRGRNDPLRSAVMGEIAKDCHDIALDARNRVPTPGSSAYIQQMFARASALDLLIDALGTPNQMTIYSEVQTFLDSEFDQAAIKDGLAAGKPAPKNEVELRFMVTLADTCRRVIRDQL